MAGITTKSFSSPLRRIDTRRGATPYRYDSTRLEIRSSQMREIYAFRLTIVVSW